MVCENTAQKAASKMACWKTDPVQWGKDVLGFELDEWQKDVARAFVRDPRCAMKACKGPGKSFLMAFLGWWYIMMHPHPIGAAVSITGDNLRDGLWTELKRLQNRSPILSKMFTWTKTKIYANEAPATWWYSARTFDSKASDEEQSNTLAGLHNEEYENAILIMLDEAGDMPPGLVAAADAVLANGGIAKILMAGNPTSTSGALYEVCVRQRKHWHVTEITSDPEDPKRTPRVSIQWAKDTIEMWGGRESPFVMVNILGQFPSKGFNKLFSLQGVEYAMGRHINKMLYENQCKVLAIDVAGEGDDRTVLFARQGLATFNPIIMRNVTPEQIATQIQLSYNKFQPDFVVIDNTGGWAGAVRILLKQMNIPCIPVGFAEKAGDDKQFYNRRAEMYWKAAEWMREGGILPPAAKAGEILEELVEPSYSFKKDRILLEPKDLIKQRLGRSPDIADAFALTFSIPIPPSRKHLKKGGAGGVVKAKSDWVPGNITGQAA